MPVKTGVVESLVKRIQIDLIVLIYPRAGIMSGYLGLFAEFYRSNFKQFNSLYSWCGIKSRASYTFTRFA